MAKKLPPGLWYEHDRRRWRVRRYRNRVPYLKGYYATKAEALAALRELNEELMSIPKRRVTATTRTNDSR